MAAEIVRRLLPELQRDGRLNQVVDHVWMVEAMLAPWRDEIVEQTTAAVLKLANRLKNDD